MTHPGGRGWCPDCGAELEEARSGGVAVLRCPWARAGEVSCGRPYARPRVDPAMEYQREGARRR